MSEIEEPPAKVLKIDNIDGVTHVTEVQGLPDDLIEGRMMAEEAEVGGGAELEQEGQEEWLSEGILTDDDYIPASRGDGDQTDSQVGTSHDEENTEDSTEQLDTTAESESNVAGLENETNTAEAELNTTESGANKSESGENVDDTDGIVSTKYIIESETYTQMFDLKIRSKTVESGASVAESKAERGSRTNITRSKANITGSKAHVEESKTNITESKTNNNGIKANNSETTANVKESVANNGSQAKKNSDVQDKDAKICLEENIEETMKHLDGSKEDELKQDLFDSLLVKKVDVKSEKKVKPETKQDQDGNDTDDLLRMLGEDDGKSKKKLTKTVKDIRATVNSGNASSDDDDFVYEGSAVKKIKAAKTALAKKQPMKAEPEDMGDGDDENDMSPDETKTMQNIFGMKTRAKSQSGKAQNKSSAPVRTPQVLVQRLPKTIKSTVRVIQKPTALMKAKVPQKQYQNKRLAQSPAKPKPKPVVTAQPPFVQSVDIKRAPTTTTPVKQPAVKTTEPTKSASVPFKPSSILKTPESFKSSTGKTVESFKSSTVKTAQSLKTSSVSFKPSPVKTAESFKSSSFSFKPSTVKTAEPFKPSSLQKSVSSHSTVRRMVPEEIIDNEEFLDEDEFDLDENEFGEPEIDMSKHRQRIMKPEIMDEEVPSDAESHSNDGSLYDELPSSDSEDLEDWFQIDIRAEKAGDYIPLLGSKAKELLLEEKRRVSVRLQTLKESHNSFCETAKKQAEQLKQATMALAELDDLLKAS